MRENRLSKLSSLSGLQPMVTHFTNLSIFLLISGSSIHSLSLILCANWVHLLQSIVYCLIVIIFPLAAISWLRMLIDCRIQSIRKQVLYGRRIILWNRNIAGVYLLGRIIIFTMCLNQLGLILQGTIFGGFRMNSLGKCWLILQELAELAIWCIFSRWN